MKAQWFQYKAMQTQGGGTWKHLGIVPAVADASIPQASSPTKGM